MIIGRYLQPRKLPSAMIMFRRKMGASLIGQSELIVIVEILCVIVDLQSLSTMGYYHGIVIEDCYRCYLLLIIHHHLYRQMFFDGGSALKE